MPMRSLRALLLLTVVFGFAGCCYDWTQCPDAPRHVLPPPPEYEDEGADIVIIGPVRTLDPSQPEATGIVIRGGVIARITSSDDAMRYASTRTKLLAVPHNGIAMPGFIESHAHLRSLGRSLRQLDLRTASSPEDVAAKVTAWAAKVSPDAWIIGRGWNQQGWTVSEWPNRVLLDQAAPGHPVALTRVDGHAMWVNSKALELAQITKATPDPNGGEIIRDQSGEPTGMLIDNAMDPVADLIAKMSTDDEVRADFLRGQEEAFKFGITTLVDAGESPAKLILLSGLYNEGSMKLRVYAMIGCSTAADLDAVFSRKPVPSLFGDRLAVRAIKMYMDGALGSRGAWLLEPYADRPGHYGFPVTDPSLIKTAVRGCLDHGYQLCVHAIGDRANRVVLDAIQEALDKTPMTGHRFRIEHAQLIEPDDMKRFRLNGVIPSIQPCHATSDAAMALQRLGAERLHRIGYPYRSMCDEWLHPAIGTDAPVEPISPLANYYSAIVRKDAAGRLPEPFMPEQSLNGLEALLGMTRYGAEATFTETRRAMLSPGYEADIVILDNDILTCNQDLIPSTGVRATIVAGEVVWDRQKVSTLRPTGN